MLRMLDLFSGIGGFSYAGEKLVGGYETVAFCEYDKHAQKVLRKHWPDTEIIDDVRELANDADRFRGLVDIVVGGYPCQPFSLAGVRRGDQDDRHLWPEMLRIIQAVRPTWVIGENVSGHIKLGLDTVLENLESEGYSARTFSISASSIGANHKRERVWIIANLADSQRLGRTEGTKKSEELTREKSSDQFDNRSEGRIESKPCQDVANSEGSNRNEHEINREHGKASSQEILGDGSSVSGVSTWWSVEPDVGRVAHGVPGRVHRLKCLGNSVVPQIPYVIGLSIKKILENE